jgi:hypothetical protein
MGAKITYPLNAQSDRLALKVNTIPDAEKIFKLIKNSLKSSSMTSQNKKKPSFRESFLRYKFINYFTSSKSTSVTFSVFPPALF